MKIVKQFLTPLSLFLLLLISIPIIYPYFTPGYFPTHDGEWAVVRLVEMFRELKDLQFPPRYSGFLNFGFGYPLFNFAYPFPYYLGVLIHAAGFSFVTTIKIIFALTVPLSAFAIYFLSRHIWKNNIAGIISAILYLYYPYRMVDLYVRGSIGESLAFVLFPVIALCLFVVLQRKRNLLALIIGGSAFGILILSHNIMAVHFMLLVIFLIGVLTLMRKFTNVLWVLSLLLLGFGLACYFWLPALFEKQFIILSQIPIADRDLYYVTLRQLLIPQWGFRPPTETAGFSYQLGIAHIMTFLGLLGLVLLSIFGNMIKEAQNYQIYIVSLLSLIVLFLLLLFPESSFIWENVPLLSEINYPWTLLLPIGFLLSVGSGYIVTTHHAGKIVGVMLAIISIVTVLPYAKPETYLSRDDAFYMTNDATTTSSSEYMPLWVKQNPKMRPAQRVIIASGVIPSISVDKSNAIQFTVTLPKQEKATINTIYYPGWNIKANNTPAPVSYDNTLGVMEVLLPKGESKVHATYSETPLRMISNGVSLSTIAFIGGLLLYTIKEKVKKKGDLKNKHA